VISPPEATTSAHAAAVRAARDSYARLLSWLAYQWRDVAAAEDALATALEKALALWPVQGIPDAPDAWLLSVAKRELLQIARHQRLHDSPEVQALLEGEGVAEELPTIPDARLKLLFVCAHPAIDAAVRPALMLQTVLGLDANVVAQAMLTSPTAMAQRLVRAKQKIRDARLKFEEPSEAELPERLHAVLEAIYAAYGLGWDAMQAGDVDESHGAHQEALRGEALYLGELVCTLLPNEPETKGLLALMLFCEARSDARFDSEDGFVPLAAQNTERWNREAIVQAEALLRAAAAHQSVGPFQLEAAIQSAHCQRLFTGETPWIAVAKLYEQLIACAPSLGAQIAHAVALAQSGDGAEARQRLRALDHPRLASYQPYWVARAHLASLARDFAEAAESFDRAIGLTSAPATRDYLRKQRASLLA
jgi:RNA polymerase sigma-70 factor (ECF subfamily)